MAKVQEVNVCPPPEMMIRKH